MFTTTFWSPIRCGFFCQEELFRGFQHYHSRKTSYMTLSFQSNAFAYHTRRRTDSAHNHEYPSPCLLSQFTTSFRRDCPCTDEWRHDDEDSNALSRSDNHLIGGADVSACRTQIIQTVPRTGLPTPPPPSSRRHAYELGLFSRSMGSPSAGASVVDTPSDCPSIPHG